MQYIGIAGIIVIILITWLMSENRKVFPWRIVIWAMILQFATAVFVLNVPFGVAMFQWLGDRVTEFLGFSRMGSQFVFGNLVKTEHLNTFGFIFAFQILPTIIFFSAWMSILYHIGVMQRIIYAFGWLMNKTLKTSGVESLSVAANIFLGQTEAVLVVKPYLEGVSRSELNAMMVGGFVNTAGGVLAGYI